MSVSPRPPHASSWTPSMPSAFSRVESSSPPDVVGDTLCRRKKVRVEACPQPATRICHLAKVPLRAMRLIDRGRGILAKYSNSDSEELRVGERHEICSAGGKLARKRHFCSAYSL